MNTTDLRRQAEQAENTPYKRVDVKSSVLLQLLDERERLLTLIRRHVEWTEEIAEDEELYVECLNQLNDMRAALAAAGEE